MEKSRKISDSGNLLSSLTAEVFRSVACAWRASSSLEVRECDAAVRQSIEKVLQPYVSDFLECRRRAASYDAIIRKSEEFI